jgi:hypothetical protein
VNFRNTFVLVLLAQIVCAVSCSTTRHRAIKEPSYQNRTLSEWLRDFDFHNHSLDQQAMAAEAIRHIGASAVPFLVERLSDAQLKQFNVEMQNWRERQATAGFTVDRPPNPRHEALAGLDALGPAAVDALPTLGKLVNGDPPDPQVLYVAARIGPASLPLLTSSLTNEVKMVRLEGQICLEMLNSRDELLYPRIPVGPDAPSFDRRLCEFNVKVLQSAYKEYHASHPEMDFPQPPPPRLPPP